MQPCWSCSSPCKTSFHPHIWECNQPHICILVWPEWWDRWFPVDLFPVPGRSSIFPCRRGKIDHSRSKKWACAAISWSNLNHLPFLEWSLWRKNRHNLRLRSGYCLRHNSHHILQHKRKDRCSWRTDEQARVYVRVIWVYNIDSWGLWPLSVTRVIWTLGIS